MNVIWTTFSCLSQLQQTISIRAPIFLDNKRSACFMPVSVRRYGFCTNLVVVVHHFPSAIVFQQ